MIKILLVDDMPQKLEIVSGWLVKYPVDIIFVSTYENACDQIVEDFDLVICDYFLHKTDVDNPGTGKLFKDAYRKMHSECFFILYSGGRDLIKDDATRAETIDNSEETLRAAIVAKIELIMAGKRPEPVKEVEIMPKIERVPLSVLITLALLVLTSVAGYSVTKYKTDTTETKLVQHCSSDDIFKEKLAVKLQDAQIATARLEEQTKALTKAVDELVKELKKQH